MSSDNKINIEWRSRMYKLARCLRAMKSPALHRALLVDTHQDEGRSAGVYICLIFEYGKGQQTHLHMSEEGEDRYDLDMLCKLLTERSSEVNPKLAYVMRKYLGPELLLYRLTHARRGD